MHGRSEERAAPAIQGGFGQGLGCSSTKLHMMATPMSFARGRMTPRKTRQARRRFILEVAILKHSEDVAGEAC